MSLDSFFSINMPYGMKRNENDEWFLFNREYVPLGWNSKEGVYKSFNCDKPFENLPVYTKYKGLTDSQILKIVSDPKLLQIEDGKIKTVFFYSDPTNPSHQKRNSKYWDYYWEDYFNMLKGLSKFVIK